MAGRAHHFRNYAAEKIPYAVERYTDEVNRLFGVMDERLPDHEFLAGSYSIADMACVGWVRNIDLASDEEARKAPFGQRARRS